MPWKITVEDDQERWQDFCESFMSTDIEIRRRYIFYTVRGFVPGGDSLLQAIEAACYIALDPNKPIDSTGSMPSFIEQAAAKKFRIKEILHVP